MKIDSRSNYSWTAMFVGWVLWESIQNKPPAYNINIPRGQTAKWAAALLCAILTGTTACSSRSQTIGSEEQASVGVCGCCEPNLAAEVVVKIFPSAAAATGLRAEDVAEALDAVLDNDVGISASRLREMVIERLGLEAEEAKFMFELDVRLFRRSDKR